MDFFGISKNQNQHKENEKVKENDSEEEQQVIVYNQKNINNHVNNGNSGSKNNVNLLASQIKYIKDKYHFFIGNYTKDFKQVQIINSIKKQLKAKYKIFDNSYTNYIICYKFIYLGYMTNEEVYYYMDNIISKLLITLVRNIKKLTCHYNKFKVRYAKGNSLIKVSLELQDENNVINNVIIPYINKFGVSPVYNREIKNNKPTIELIYTKPREGLKSPSQTIDLVVPTEPFIIDSLSLIRGTVVNPRSGNPSKNDNLNFDEVKKYRYNLM